MITLGPILVNGGWCHIYAVEGHPELCAKVLIPKRRFKGDRPDPNIIVNSKYGINDFLNYEWENYQKIMSVCPTNLRMHFVTIHGIKKTDDGRQALVMEKIIDDRGHLASTLANSTRKVDLMFIETLEELRKKVFLKNGLDHFGIARRNILIRSTSDPVIIDFQSEKERYRWQFWLQIKWFVKRKVNRCFNKLYSEIEINK